MGIKGGFNNFLKKKNCKHKNFFPMHKFQNKRITIDSGIWLYSNMSVVLKNYVSSMKNPLDIIDKEKLFERLVKNFISFNMKFLNEKITPIWIWDGNKNSEFKKAERDKRYAKKENDMRLKKELENILREQNPLLRSDTHINKYKELLCRVCFLNQDMIEKIKNLCDMLGIPNIQAEGEAESLAASLVVEGLAKAVWTKDTDVFPIMPKYILGSFEEKEGEILIEVSSPLVVAKTLELDEESFRDFCIMCGTDFNKNIPKYGPDTSYKLIKKYKKIENIEFKNEVDCTCLNVEICRKLLTPINTGFIDREHELIASLPTSGTLEEIRNIYPYINPIEIYRRIENLKYKHN